MSEYREIMVNDIMTKVKVAEDGQVPLSLDFGDVQSFYEPIREEYLHARAEFFDSTADEPELINKSRALRKASRSVVGYAAMYHAMAPKDTKHCEEAFKIENMLANDGEIVLRNIKLNLDITRERMPENRKQLDKIINELHSQAHHLFRLQANITRVQKNRTSMDAYIRRDRDLGKKCARVNRLRFESLPSEEIYSPAKPYPPIPVPAGEPVPPRPKAFDVFRLMPPDGLDYDSEHHEFVIKEGYVNEKLQMDSDSIKWNWDEETVTCKFIGGPPVTWKFWKPYTVKDNLNGWVEDYYHRLYWDLEDNAVKCQPCSTYELHNNIPDYDQPFFDHHVIDNIQPELDRCQEHPV